MFRRSAVVAGAASGFLLEVFRDNHAKGLVSFLEDVGGGAIFSGATVGCGGEWCLTEDVLPGRPWMSLAKSRDPRRGRLGCVVEVLALSETCQPTQDRRGVRASTHHCRATHRPCLMSLICGAQ